MKRIEKFNEEIKKYSISADYIADTNCIDAEKILKSIQNLTKIIDLLPLPVKIAGIPVTPLYMIGLYDGITLQVKKEFDGNATIGLKLGTWNHAFPMLYKRIQKTIVKTSKSLTESELFTEQEKAYEKFANEAPSFIKDELSAIRDELQARLDYLNEEVEDDDIKDSD